MMARRKEIDRERILDIAYKKALTDGIENLTARSIAQTGHFSTQPIYLEFKNMDGLRKEVLKRVSRTLRDEILQKKFIGEPYTMLTSPTCNLPATTGACSQRFSSMGNLVTT
ncbi:TetR/AcrR family transcriptional regulator [Lactobacillus delbrueckii subsp. lactis]|nr:TetR/AcrR family transcriptional regulator [Lactobacillus delbrueckii]MCD5547682.1 TetR/AcrR family transcriptional regulator [Lactobacillus delbrueckii subsp. lactis]